MKYSEIRTEGKEVLKKYKEIIKTGNKERWKEVIQMLRAKAFELNSLINMYAEEQETVEIIKERNATESALRQMTKKFGDKFIKPKYQNK